MAGRTEVERALLARGTVVMTLRSIVDVDMMRRVEMIVWKLKCDGIRLYGGRSMNSVFRRHL